MIVHHVLSIAVVAHALERMESYATRGELIVDIGNELILYVTSVLLSQFGVASGQYDDSALENMTLICLAFLILFNLTHVIVSSVQDRREKKHKSRVLAYE